MTLTERWSNFAWHDLKCRRGYEGALVTEGLCHDEEFVTGIFYDGSPRIETRSVTEWADPLFEKIALHWRVRDAFGFVTWEKYPEDVRAAFEAFMLAGEVSRAYAYAHDRSLLRY